MPPFDAFFAVIAGPRPSQSRADQLEGLIH
jgi:hypothetical protein